MVSQVCVFSFLRFQRESQVIQRLPLVVTSCYYSLKLSFYLQGFSNNNSVAPFKTWTLGGGEIISTELVLEMTTIRRNIQEMIDVHSQARDVFESSKSEIVPLAQSLGFYPRTVREVRFNTSSVESLITFFEDLCRSLHEKNKDLDQEVFAMEISHGIGLFLEMDFDSHFFLTQEKLARDMILKKEAASSFVMKLFSARNDVRVSRYKDGWARKKTSRMKSSMIDRRDLRGIVFWDLLFKKYFAKKRLKIRNKIDKSLLSSVHADSLSENLYEKDVTLNSTLLIAHIMYFLFSEAESCSANPISEEAIRKLLSRERKGIVMSSNYLPYLVEHKQLMTSELPLWRIISSVLAGDALLGNGESLESLLLVFRRVDLAICLEEHVDLAELSNSYLKIIEPIKDTKTIQLSIEKKFNPYKGSEVRELLGRVVDDLPLDARLS